MRVVWAGREGGMGGGGRVGMRCRTRRGIRGPFFNGVFFSHPFVSVLFERKST